MKKWITKAAALVLAGSMLLQPAFVQADTQTQTQEEQTTETKQTDQKVIVIDPRYFKCSLKELMSMHDVTDALFLNYILAPGTPQRVNEIEKVVRN